MIYDHEKATAAAFFAVSETARLLREALNREQEISFDVQSLPDAGYRILVQISSAIPNKS